MVAEPGGPAGDGTGIPVPAGGPEANAAGEPNNNGTPLLGTVPGAVLGTAPSTAQAVPAQAEVPDLLRGKRGMARTDSAPVIEEERKKRVTVNREATKDAARKFQEFYGWGKQQQLQQQQQQQQRQAPQQAQQQGGFGMGSTFQAPGTPTTNGGAQYASAGYWGENEKETKGDASFEGGHGGSNDHDEGRNEER